MITVPWWLPAAVAAFILGLFIVTWTWAYKDGHEAGRQAEHARATSERLKLQAFERAVSFVRRNNPPSQWDTGPLLLERFDRMIGSRQTGEFTAAPEHKER